MDDRSDILGGQLHVARPEPIFALSGPSLSGTLFYGFLLIVVVAGLYSFTPHYRQYQEQRHRRAMRRRHGIPDSDHRPFNVAYAAVKRAQKEREMAEKGKLKLGIRLAPGTSNATIRQNSSVFGQATQPSGVLPQASQLPMEEPAAPIRSSYTESRRTSGQTTTASESDIHIPGAPQENGTERLAPAGSKQTLYAPAFTRGVPAAAVGGKHARDDEIDMEDEQGTKKSRVDHLHAFDEDAQWEADVDDDMEVDEASPIHRKRGTKRLASIEEDEGFESSKVIGRDKRARKVSPHGAKNMRGKKRDRAEAGSSFGGDNSSVEDEDEDKHRSNRRRRLAHKKSLLNLRSRKRVREPELDSDESDSDSPMKRAARHKRGKRSPKEDDFLSDDGMISHDPLCKGRRIGEEWETNGVKYKVGPNGQRLRQALVKKSRSRFPMPKDSEHPDRKANIDVYVETWLSEEEYQAAKERNELAWQSPSASGTELPHDSGSPTKGKSLLWSSAAQKDGIRKALPLAKSVSANTALRVTASSSSNGVHRRISTIVAPVQSSIPDSPKVKSSKSYSKWEKQDLEAAAMARLREKVKAEDAAAAPKPATTSAPITFPTLAKPADTTSTTKSAEAPKPASTFSFDKPAAAPAAAKASPSDLPSLSIPSSTPKPAEPAKPATLTFPSSTLSTVAEPPKPTTSTSTPAFSFGKPAQPTSTSTSTGSSSAPNLFAKPSAPAPAPNSTTNLFGSQQPSATAPAPASTPSLFGDKQSATTGPSPFGATPQPASQPPTKTPFSFGATAGADKKSEKSETKPAETSQGQSLLARMGGFAGSGASTTAAPASAPSAPASQPSNPFSFGKPAAPTTAAAAAPSSTTSGAAPVKFNFGVTSKPASSNPPSAPALEAPKPTATFSFAGKDATTAPAENKTEAPKFSFGGQPATSGGTTSGSTNVFGNTGGSSSSLFGAVNAPKDVTATPQSKSAFGQTAFPSTPANQTAKATLFGASTTPAGTPSGSIFGAKPAEPQTPANNTASPMSMSTTPAGTPGTTALFSNTAATTTPAGPPPKSAFSFGSNVSTTPAGAPPKPAFSFGTTATPSMFGGTGTSSGFAETKAPEPAKGSFAFGATPASASATQGASSTAPKFSFGATSNNSAAQPSGTMSSAPSSLQSKPSFTFGGSSAAPTSNASQFSFGPSAGAGSTTENKQSTTQQPAGMFGFGASAGSSAFSFGQSKPPESGQK